METELEKKLAHMIRSNRVAGLGTLRDGAPLVSMIAYLPEDDFSTFYIHISQLAQHTRAMLADARVGLLISEADDGRTDPKNVGAHLDFRHRRTDWHRGCELPFNSITFRIAFSGFCVVVWL